MRTLKLVAFLVSVAATNCLNAAEISLLSGLYRAEKQKDDGKDAGGQSEMTAGVRYGDKLNETMDWFVRPLLTMRSYEAADGQESASDSISLAALGGVRLNFLQFSPSLTPFISGHAGFVSEKTADPDANTETQSQGLHYGGSVGFRFNISQAFFFDLETALFDSALFSTETTEAIDKDAADAPTKKEKTKTELYVESAGGISTSLFGLGYKF